MNNVFTATPAGIGPTVTSYRPVGIARFPYWTLTGLMLWLMLSAVSVLFWWNHKTATERFDLFPYVKSYIGIWVETGRVHFRDRFPWGVGISPITWSFTVAGKEKNGRYVFATPETPAGEIIARRLDLHPSQMYEALGILVYGFRGLLDVFKPIGIVIAVLFLALCGLGGFADSYRIFGLRNGKHLRGWRVLSYKQWNRKVRGDGVSFAVRPVDEEDKY